MKYKSTQPFLSRDSRTDISPLVQNVARMINKARFEDFGDSDALQLGETQLDEGSKLKEVIHVRRLRDGVSVQVLFTIKPNDGGDEWSWGEYELNIYGDIKSKRHHQDPYYDGIHRRYSVTTNYRDGETGEEERIAYYSDRGFLNEFDRKRGVGYNALLMDEICGQVLIKATSLALKREITYTTDEYVEYMGYEENEEDVQQAV
jgi:hypothetical protein